MALSMKGVPMERTGMGTTYLAKMLSFKKASI